MAGNPTNMKLALIERTDSNGDSYYIGSANYDFPVMVDLSTIDFLIFHPEDPDAEEGDERRYATMVIRGGNRNAKFNKPR